MKDDPASQLDGPPTIAYKYMVQKESLLMKPSVAYPVAVGVSIFLVLLFLDALHVAEHSAWRAALVGVLCSIAVYWAGPKLTGKSGR